jgi:hypothetical protein
MTPRYRPSVSRWCRLPSDSVSFVLAPTTEDDLQRMGPQPMFFLAVLGPAEPLGRPLARFRPLRPRGDAPPSHSGGPLAGFHGLGGASDNRQALADSAQELPQRHHLALVVFDAVARGAGPNRIGDEARRQMPVVLLDHPRIGVPQILRHHQQRARLARSAGTRPPPAGPVIVPWLGQWSYAYAIVWSKLPSQKSDGFPKELAINSIESPNRESD